MRFEHKGWIPTAWVLTALNVAAVWFTAQPGEAWHATLHAALAVGFALGAQRLAARQRASLSEQADYALLEADEKTERVLDGMQARVLELEEQLEFAESLLAQHRSTPLPAAPD